MTSVPVNAALSITDVTDVDLNPIIGSVYGDTVYVFGDGVTAGTEVKIFWDYASGIDTHLLNTTEGKPDGTFECEIEVPSDTAGDHYLWATDTSTGETVSYGPIEMVPLIKLSHSSGLIGDGLILTGYGFGDGVDVDTIEFDDSPLTTNPSIPVTDGGGSWEATFNVQVKVDGVYEIVAEDEDGNTASVVFKVGPAMTLDIEEGSVGTVVEVTGRGFTPSVAVNSITLDDIVCKVLDEGDLNINSNGVFTLEFFIPSVSTADKEYVLQVIDGEGNSAEMNFLVTDITNIELEPQFGAPGSSVVITGQNFAAISGLDVEIKFDGTLVKTLETNSNGDISGTFMIPAISAGNYQVKAEQQSYNIEASKTFRAGTIVMLLAPRTGPTGTRVILTGMGFTPGGKWDAYLGDVIIFEDMTVRDDTTLSGVFYIPTVESGDYSVTVVDLDEDIDVEIDFTVTEITFLSLTPGMAPVGLNVSVEGMYFAESMGDIDVEFVLYNSTDDWSIDVYMGTDSVTTDEEGAFTAWWLVPESLSLGRYTVNATDDEGLFSQFSFEVVSKFTSITPHKSTYNRDDTVRFNIESSFEEVGSYITIYDSEEKFIWKTDDLNTWIETEVTYVAPFYTQTAGGNLMILGNDAPRGTWTWTWYDNDDETLSSGTFTVEEPTPENGGNGDDTEDDITDEIITALQQSIQDLELEIAQLSSDLQDTLVIIENMPRFDSESMEELQADVEDTAEIVAESKQEAEDAKALALEAKVIADQLKEGVDEANLVAEEAKTLAEEAKADAEENMKLSNVLKFVSYIALILSLILAGMKFIGPLQITRKPPV